MNKNKRIVFATINFSLLLFSLIIIGTTACKAQNVRQDVRTFSQINPKDIVSQAWQIVHDEFLYRDFKGVDWEKVGKKFLSRNYSNQEEAYHAIRKMLQELDDPYTRFLEPYEYLSLQTETMGEIIGIGISIIKDGKTKEIKIISSLEGSPAEKAGLMPQDVIIAVNGQSTQKMDVEEVSRLIRGPLNTRVRLTVRRGRQILNYDISRSRVKIQSVRFRRIEPLPVRYSLQVRTQYPVGYIRLVSFSSTSVQELEDAIFQLERQGVNGYILDLRSNPGGLLSSAIEIARLFIPKGNLVLIVDRKGIREEIRAESYRGVLTDKPLVVLINSSSASASEIVAGALQDYARAVLVGTRTFGKGVIQSVYPIGSNAGISITVAKYTTPKGRDIDRRGIIPDVYVPLSVNQIEQLNQLNPTVFGTDKDIQFLKALSVLHERIFRRY